MLRGVCKPSRLLIFFSMTISVTRALDKTEWLLSCGILLPSNTFPIRRLPEGRLKETVEFVPCVSQDLNAKLFQSLLVVYEHRRSASCGALVATTTHARNTDGERNSNKTCTHAAEVAAGARLSVIMGLQGSIPVGRKKRFKFLRAAHYSSLSPRGCERCRLGSASLLGYHYKYTNGKYEALRRRCVFPQRSRGHENQNRKFSNKSH